MTLQLSGKTERMLDPHKEFYGHPKIQMPLLVSGKDEEGNIIDVPRNPASFAYVIERRMNAPEDVREAWQKNYFFTGDGSTAGKKGDHLIVLDAQPLREITGDSELFNGALVLSNNAWNELKRQKNAVLYLTANEVQAAQGKGYVKKNGIWTPDNKTVGKVGDMLNRGQNLTPYLQLVSENSPHSDSLLNIYFNPTLKDSMSTMRAWVASRIDSSSSAYGSDSDDCGRLVGVAPEAHIAREKLASPSMVQPPLEQILAVINNPDLNREGMVTAASKLYKR